MVPGSGGNGSSDLHFQCQVVDGADAQLFHRQFAGDYLAPVLDAAGSEEAVEPCEVPCMFRASASRNVAS